MFWLVVLVGVLAVMSAADNDSVQYNQELLEAIYKTGRAATKLMDSETYKAFSLVQRKMAFAVKSGKLDNKQLSAAMDLVMFISRKLEEGRIELSHIKYFIALSQSGMLSKLLTTWDHDLLKKQ